MCVDEFLKDSEARDDMVLCKCKKSAVDAEEGYYRFIGKPKLICEGNIKPKQRWIRY